TMASGISAIARSMASALARPGACSLAGAVARRFGGDRPLAASGAALVALTRKLGRIAAYRNIAKLGFACRVDGALGVALGLEVCFDFAMWRLVIDARLGAESRL